MKRQYRHGLLPHEMLFLRSMRARGFAVAIMPPCDVGDKLNRKPVEDAMIKAAKKTIREMREEGVAY